MSSAVSSFRISVADAVLEGGGERLPLLQPGAVAAAVLVVHAVGEHHAPLVVVAAEHELADVGELVVLRNLCRRDVAVIVEDRHVLRILMIQLLRHVIFEQEIRVHKLFHGNRPPFDVDRPSDQTVCRVGTAS